MKIPYPGLYDDEITEAADGTFTVNLAPWFVEPITGIPTRDLALRFCHAASEAMKEYAANCMVED